MTTALNESDIAGRVEDILADHEGMDGACLPVLLAVQRAFGYVPPQALQPVADALSLTHADVYGVLTFYHDLRRAPPGRHVVRVCQAEACQAMGTAELTAALERLLGVSLGETATDGSVTFEPVYCLGNCALSPAVCVDGVMLGRATEERVAARLAELP